MSNTSNDIDTVDSAPAMFVTGLPVLTRRSQIAAFMRQAIFSGQLQPGTPLVETRLAQQFGVSRGPLREAIRELSEEGLLLNKPYVGTYVVEVSAKTLAEAYGLRRVLERHAFESIWFKRSEAYRKELRLRHANLMEAVDAGDLALEIGAEMAFHRFPYEFSQNGVLLDMWEMLSQKIRLGFTLYQQSIGEPLSGRDAHDTYVRCALGDDLNAMCAEIDVHIDAGLKSVLGYLQNRT